MQVHILQLVHFVWGMRLYMDSVAERSGVVDQWIRNEASSQEVVGSITVASSS